MGSIYIYTNIGAGAGVAGAPSEPPWCIGGNLKAIFLSYSLAPPSFRERTDLSHLRLATYMHPHRCTLDIIGNPSMDIDLGLVPRISAIRFAVRVQVPTSR